MIRHAKASPAGPTRRQAKGLGGLIRGAAAAAAFALLALVVAAPAGATQYQRHFKETFGSAEQPSFGNASTLAVDPGTGDLLVGDSVNKTIKRFHPDGTPSPFVALGSNTIDGKQGAGGKECAEEPASCDKTPQNGIEVSNQHVTQIAIDNSGGPTDGDIYVTQMGARLVDIFSSEGRYLGQLTLAGAANFNSPCGVAVDPSGAVYVSEFLGPVSKFVPSANPPVNDDNTASFPLPGGQGICSIAVGTGPTANWIFGTNINGTPHIFKVNKETGELQYRFGGNGDFGLNPLTVDPTTGRVLVSGPSGGEATEFDASGASGAIQVGRLIGESSFGQQGLAANSSGEIFVAKGSQVEVYGLPAVVPTVTAEPAGSVTGTKAILAGSVNPEGLEVTECFFKYGETTSYGNTAPCEGAIPTDSSPHSVHLSISGLEPNGHTYHYRLFAKNANGTEESADQTLVTAQTVETQVASGIGTATATLNGTVRPEGDQYTSCFFEYGLSSNAGFEKTAPCNPVALGIEPDFSPHSVSAAIGGLQRGATYRFRLVATNSEGTLSGKALTFTTLGPPQISQLQASFADQSSVTLEAKINPSGFGTSYRFEWGPTASYGNSVPAEFEPFAGSGTEPIRVSAKITSLSAATTYHFRVVASNSIDTTVSPDATLETLNSCGLPEGRCYELVSPRDAGPVALPGATAGSVELAFQAATEPGSLAYIVETGFPDATKGAEVLYRGTRDNDGWGSTQLSPPLLVRSETSGGASASAKILGLSPDLSCGVVTSNQPLTDDPSTRLVVEAGGANLYRRNPDGSYTAISKLAPENPAGGGEALFAMYTLYGFSPDCSHVLFGTPYHYPGVPTLGSEPLYEWDEGTLRSVGFVPGPSGEVPIAASPGGGGNYVNVLSEDASRTFFNAERQTSPNPAEIGKTGVFVREDGTTTRDLSLSETSTPDKGATYQYATKDGSRVFFTANAGLTDESSSEGTDLYEYDLESEELTDLSVDHEDGGAQVAGFIGASEDGSHVYFLARGQLVPGKGKSFAENVSEKTNSVYGEAGGVVSYAGSVRENQQSSVRIQGGPGFQTSRVSPNGRYLLFESSVDLTGYDSGEGVSQGGITPVREAYLYDANATSEPTVCISCRQDGRKSVTLPSVSPLEEASGGNPLRVVQTLTEHEGKPRVVFSSFDRLATGAAEGRANVYEWAHGQVFLITTEPPGLQDKGEEEVGFVDKNARFIDASSDGTDLYFATPQTLNWEDGDGRPSIYDARIGGGFPEPPVPPAPCEPKSEGSCQGGAPPAGAPTPTPSSSTFNGPGNLKPKAQHKKRKKRHHRKRKARHAKHKRQANGNRRAGK